MNELRELVRDHLEEYLKAAAGLITTTELQIERTKRWANGESIHAIAKSENVWNNAVERPVKNLAKRVKEWYDANNS